MDGAVRLPAISCMNRRPADPQNAVLAANLRELADLLTAQGADGFRVAAYRRAADVVQALDRPVSDILTAEGRQGLVALPGIGRGIASALAEMTVRGHWSQLERLRGILQPEDLFRTVPGIIPGIEVARDQFGGNVAAAAIAALGVSLGALTMAALNEWVPHEHFFQGRQGPTAPELARVWLFVLAITIHNLPEGLAVGVGFGGGDTAGAITLAVGIGLQNAPEGLAVALALLSTGYSRMRSFLIAGLTGNGRTDVIIA